jgi:hypothetical protein
MKLCRDCRYFNPDGTYIGSTECNHPKATVLVEGWTDPIDGRYRHSAKWQEDPYTMRRPRQACGPDAALFERRDSL